MKIMKKYINWYLVKETSFRMLKDDEKKRNSHSELTKHCEILTWEKK